MKNIILKIKKLKKNYLSKTNETTAIDDFSLELDKGEFIAIVGPSGSGKTTLLSILSGLLPQTSGDIEIDKTTKIGYMLQQDSLFEWRTILNNCLLSLEINNDINEKNKNYVLSLLNKYGLYEFKDERPSKLSGGMRQRVG